MTTYILSYRPAGCPTCVEQHNHKGDALTRAEFVARVEQTRVRLYERCGAARRLVAEVRH